MNPDDQLSRFLRSADAAANRPALYSGLPARIRLRQQERGKSAHRIRVGLVTSAVIIVAAIALRSVYLLDAGRPAARSLPDAEIAQLRAESDSLAAEAAALERQIAAARAEQCRQDIREEYRHQLAANATAEACQSPIDRAAAIALCQGDFYWEVQQNRAPARAAYQSILDNFPTSSLASVAQARLQQLQMN
jgi:hypothetical protein